MSRALLTWKTGQQDSRHVRVFNPSLHVNRSGLMVDNDDIGRDIGDSKHKIVPGVPGSQVIPVSNVAIHIDVFFAAVAVKEYHGHFGTSRGTDGQVVVKVIERPLDEGLVEDRATLDRLQGRNEVREVGGSWYSMLARLATPLPIQYSPLPHPMASVPSTPPRSGYPLGPRMGGPASLPINAILLVLRSGSVPFSFLSRIVDAAPTFLTISACPS